MADPQLSLTLVTLAGAAALVDAGVTDFRCNARFTSSGEQLVDEIGGLVDAFRPASR